MLYLGSYGTREVFVRSGAATVPCVSLLGSRFLRVGETGICAWRAWVLEQHGTPSFREFHEARQISGHYARSSRVFKHEVVRGVA